MGLNGYFSKELSWFNGDLMGPNGDCSWKLSWFNGDLMVI